MAIDYEQARKRIILKFIGGMIKTYGVRHMKKVTQKYTKPGKHTWEKDHEWTDPKGIARKGAFLRMPSVEAEQTFEIPQGVVPAEMLQYASAMSDAFLEVLRIAEDNGVSLEHANHPFMEVVHTESEVG